ncbi:MAG: hypothetical protein Q7U66_14050 [Methylobacter sp.]|nr:hypothetical protein [Methylobacter sp.]
MKAGKRYAYLPPGFLGSYLNIFLQQPAGFIGQLKHSQSSAAADLFYSLYGIRRTNPETSQYYDWFNKTPR